MNNNPINYEGPEINEGINPLFGQELLIIPESPEFDSESSSENSKSSNTISLDQKKKKIELSISENYNFSYTTEYDNLNSVLLRMGKKYETVIPIALLLLEATYMLGPVSNYRYMFPMYIMFPVYFCMAVRKGDDSQAKVIDSVG